MEGPGLGQLLGEVVLEHEGLDGQRSWPLLLAVSKDWPALSTTPCGNRDGERVRWTDTETHMRGSREADRRCSLGKGKETGRTRVAGIEEGRGNPSLWEGTLLLPSFVRLVLLCL